MTHIAALQLKAGLTLITNLGQVCLFSDLITIPVQCCEFCVGVVGTQLFFTGFKVEIYWDDPNLKIGREVLKEENQISRGEPFFPFYQLKLLSHFVSVSPDTYTKREIPRIKFNG